MRIRQVINQAGFEAVAIMVVVLVLGVVGFASYKVLQNGMPAVQQPTAAVTTEPDTIKSKSDLANTSKALDSSAAELDKDLDDSQLDADLNAVL